MPTETLARLHTNEEIDRRIRFDPERQVIELDLSRLHLRKTSEVNAFYDRLEERIDASGEELWFFLVIYSDMRIEPAAWVAYLRRGKMLKKAHSMGTVRVDACPETVAQIRRSAGTDAFDPNLFADRAAALRHLSQLPSRRLRKIRHKRTYTDAEFAARITFLMEDRILDLDFSDFTFHNSRDVDDFYDFIESRIEQTGQKWFVLVNYNNCRIEPAAWVAYSRRVKRLNEGGSLGTVRYAVDAETEADIRLRQQVQAPRPNIRNSRKDAMARIAELKCKRRD